MKVLIGCEESQTVCKAFRELGHQAYSCDIIDCSGGHSEWHIKGDVLEVLNDGWDIGIFHPPCTRLCNSGVCWLEKRNLWEEMRQGANFFKQLLYSNIPKVAVENPIMHKYALEIIGTKYSQTIQPYEFGEDASKRTCLWLKNLPLLLPTDFLIKKRYANQTPSGRCNLPPSKDRAKLRSKTYPGIAKAMAEQWGGVL